LEKIVETKMRAQEHIPISIENFGHMENASIKRFVFLDSFRGLCAFFVMFHHAFIYGKIFEIEKEDTNRLNIILNNIFQANVYFSQTLAVNGFFILSSFLLTYRFILDITDSDKSIIEIIKVTYLPFTYIVQTLNFANISLDKLALSTRLEKFINSHGYFSNYDVKFNL